MLPVTERPRAVEIVDVGPRDGFQPIGPFIPTDRKIAIIARLADAGLRRIEITSFVSNEAVPQLRDSVEIVAAARDRAGLCAQVLVPTARRAQQALAADAKALAYVLSISEAHNRGNVRRSVADSIADYALVAETLPAGVFLRCNLATAFDCPFEGRIEVERALEVIGAVARVRDAVEICLCDTTGRATPDQVGDLFNAAINAFPQVESWAFHGHDTYGLGTANVFAAYMAGINVIDASIGGLGGCPFAPGATGNVATEDVVWMFERMGINTGIDLPALIQVADEVAKLPGAASGGRVRDVYGTAPEACWGWARRAASSGVGRRDPG